MPKKKPLQSAKPIRDLEAPKLKAKPSDDAFQAQPPSGFESFAAMICGC